MLNGEDYSSAKSFTTLNSVENTRKKKNKINKRKFSDEQIKSLEVMFESESKLEPRKKLQLARELGLQPRQVAIWFQNKRARWKSKKLERDYSILEANYNSLATKFEALKKEKQDLTIQLQKLNDLIQKPREGKSQCCSIGLERSCNDGESYNGDTTNIRCKSEAKPSLCSERTEHVVGVFSDDDDSSIKAEYFELEEEPHLLNNMVEPADGSLTSSDNWGSLDTDGLFDESSSSYQWWDFWS